MPKNFEKKIACEVCTVAKYCGTMVGSIRLCRSIHEQLERKEQEKLAKEVNPLIVKIDAYYAGAYAVFKIEDKYFRIDKATALEIPNEELDILIVSSDADGKVNDWETILWKSKGDKELLQCIKEFSNEYFQDEFDKHLDLIANN